LIRTLRHTVIGNAVRLVTVLIQYSHRIILGMLMVSHNAVSLLCVAGGFGALSESWLKDKSPENCLSSVEIYDPETNSWTAGPDLPVPLCAMGVVKYYGTVYVLGMSS